MLLAGEVEAEQELANLQELAEGRLKDAREAEAKMVDFVMDRESFRQDAVDNLLGRIPPVTHKDIEHLVQSFLTRKPDKVVYTGGRWNMHHLVPDRFRQTVSGSIP